ncbi:hypothetical protein C7271_04770 [filamentous cyanobacterium CCP5]|nr:hypothetical protein C7271_04770 [filamentous cyanobacterium CCP5]
MSTDNFEPEMDLITAVIGINLALAGLCFWAACRFWHLRCQLVQVSDRLSEVLYQAAQLDTRGLPGLILQGRQSTAAVRRQGAILQRQLSLIGQGLALLGWLQPGQRWRRWSRAQRSRSR